MYKLKYLILVIVVILGLGCSKSDDGSGGGSNMKLSDIKINFKNKKYVLNGGTQNWVLNGFDRKFKNQSKIKSQKRIY